MSDVTTTAPAVQSRAPASPDFQAERTALVERQYKDVLEALAGRAATLNSLLMHLQNDHDISGSAGVLLDAAQQLSELIGAIADDAIDGVVFGDMRHWLHGPNFKRAA